MWNSFGGHLTNRSRTRSHILPIVISLHLSLSLTRSRFLVRQTYGRYCCQKPTRKCNLRSNVSSRTFRISADASFNTRIRSPDSFFSRDQSDARPLFFCFNYMQQRSIWHTHVNHCCSNSFGYSRAATSTGCWVLCVCAHCTVHVSQLKSNISQTRKSMQFRGTNLVCDHEDRTQCPIYYSI